MSNVTDAARRAIEQGYAPIPIPRGKKRPMFKGWVSARYTAEEVTERFDPQANIGLLLGKPSNGLVDVDMDSPAAVELASAFLPPTKMLHGREGSPLSHWWYQVDHPPQVTKYADPLDRASLVEIRGTGGQTIIPPSLHPSGEKVRWHSAEKGWSKHPPAEVHATQLDTAVSTLAAATLLAKYWPDPGSRHDAALALCGGLLRGGWSDEQTVEFVQLVAEVGGDDEARERRLDVGTTRKRLDMGKPTQGWPSLEEHLPSEIVAKARDWLRLEITAEVEDWEEGEEGIRNFRAIDQAIRDGVPEHKQIVPGLLYANMIHWWHGEPESGKSLLLLSVCLDLVNQGYKVMWIDEESGLTMTADRLARLGADPDKLNGNFYYYEFPGITMSEEDRVGMLQTIEEIQPSLVVMDSCADMLTQAGLDEDDNQEITTWYRHMLQPIAQRDAAVVVIDHVVKSKDARGTYARGGGAKKSKTDVAWALRVESRFALDPPKLGIIELKINKDRLGRLPGRVTYKIGGKADGTTHVHRQDDGGQISDSRQRIRVETTNYLLENASSPDRAVTAHKVCKSIEGGKDTIREVLEDLRNDEDSLVRSYLDSTEDGKETRYFWATDSAKYIEVDFS